MRKIRYQKSQSNKFNIYRATFIIMFICIYLMFVLFTTIEKNCIQSAKNIMEFLFHIRTVRVTWLCPSDKCLWERKPIDLFLSKTWKLRKLKKGPMNRIKIGILQQQRLIDYFMSSSFYLMFQLNQNAKYIKSRLFKITLSFIFYISIYI